MRFKTPYIDINLKKIYDNARTLLKLFSSRNISIMGITKVCLGDAFVAKTLLDAGIHLIGDSRIDNIKRMKEAGINATFVLIRNPSLSEISSVVEHVDISFNSELEIIQKLSEESIKQKKTQGIILMIEMGDLREGIMPAELDDTIEKILHLKGVILEGIGTNLKCFSGVIPDNNNMTQLSDLALHVQEKFEIKLNYISGGNSANYDWFMNTTEIGAINNLRIGTALLLGYGGINEDPIPNLHRDAFQFVAEIVQLKEKPSYPTGTLAMSAFGEESIFLKRKHEKGEVRQMALLNAGRQDIIEKKMNPLEDIEIMSATSDYIILNLKKGQYNLGDEIRFILEYEALLSAMTSPFVSRHYID